MNGFLVIARTMSDDIPLWMFSTLELAQSYAFGCTNLLTADEAAIMSYDGREIVCVVIVEFVSGAPRKMSIAKNFT